MSRTKSRIEEKVEKLLYRKSHPKRHAGDEWILY